MARRRSLLQREDYRVVLLMNQEQNIHRSVSYRLAVCSRCQCKNGIDCHREADLVVRIVTPRSVKQTDNKNTNSRLKFVRCSTNSRHSRLFVAAFPRVFLGLTDYIWRSHQCIKHKGHFGHQQFEVCTEV